MSNKKNVSNLSYLTKSLVLAGLMTGSVTAVAEDMGEMEFNEVVYEFTDGKLHEKYGGEDFVTYTKKSLPASCTALEIENIAEQHSQQPSSDIVGSWEMEDFMDEDMEFDDDFDSGYKGYVNIRANGQIEGYDFNEGDSSCYVYSVQELNGNKLSFDDGIDIDLSASLIKVKLTDIDQQLAVVSVRQEEMTMEESTESYTYADALIYDKAEALPASCDISTHIPSSENSNDNPSDAYVGNWVASDIYSGEGDEQDVEFKDYFIVTGDGFLLEAFWDKAQEQENCEVVFIGETVGDQYTK